MFRKTAIALTFLLLFSALPNRLNAEQTTNAATSKADATSAEAAKSQELVKHLDDTNFEKTVK